MKSIEYFPLQFQLRYNYQLSSMYKRSIFYSLLIGAEILIGCVDYFAGPIVVFSIFYAIPIIAITYYENKRYGIIASIFSSAIAAWIDYLGIVNLLENQIIITITWNFFSRLSLFVIITYLIDLLKKRIMKEKRVAEMQKQLVKEIHHRLSNNIATTIGFLNLQMLNDKTSTEYLMPVERRLAAMLNIHKNLYRQTELVIKLEEYLEELVDSFSETYQLENDNIRIELDCDHIKLDDVKAQTIGLLINELLINSKKYAFSEQNRGIIKIHVHLQDRNLQIVYQDNGIGFDYEVIQQNPNKGIGLNLIENFSAQLKATKTYKNENGVYFHFKIPIR